MDFLTTFLAIGAVLAGLLGKLLASEVQDWLPALAHRLIKFASARLVPSDRARHLEEWIADNNDYPGKLGKLVHAIGCIVASYKLGRVEAKRVRRIQVHASGSATPAKYRILVWVADGLDPYLENEAVKKEIRHCASVLDELRVPEFDRIIEVRVVDRCSPLVAVSGVFSNIWNASIEI